MFRPQSSPIHFFVPKALKQNLALDVSKSQVEVSAYVDTSHLLQILSDLKPSTTEDIGILVLDAEKIEEGKFGLRDGPFANAIVTCCSKMQTKVALYNINKLPRTWEFSSASLIPGIVTDDPSTHTILYERALDACIQSKKKEVRKERYKGWLNLAGSVMMSVLLFYLLFLQTTFPCNSAGESSLEPIDLSPCFLEKLKQFDTACKGIDLQSALNQIKTARAAAVIDLLKSPIESGRSTGIEELKKLSDEVVTSLDDAQMRLATCGKVLDLKALVSKLSECSVSPVPVAVCVDVPLLGKFNVDWVVGFARKN